LRIAKHFCKFYLGYTFFIEFSYLSNRIACLEIQVKKISEAVEMLQMEMPK